MEFSWADFIRKEAASTLSYQDAAQAYAAIDAALARSLNVVTAYKATIPQEQETPPLRMEQATLMPLCTSYGTWVPGIEASLPNGDR